MSDYTNSKPAIGAIYPISAVATQWDYLKPLITPEKLRTNFLLGLPLSFQDPITKQITYITDEILKDYILRAVEIAENELQTQITPIQIQERHPFDKRLYQAYGYFRTHYRPVSSIETISIRMADGSDIFTIPPEWIDTGYLQIGQINIVPLVPAYVNSTNTVSTAGASVFLSVVHGNYWVPAFWSITYTTGFPDMMIPGVINEIIGCIAAMDVISQLAAIVARATSASLSIDSLSQSIGTPGPQLYKLRYSELEDKKDRLIRKIKKMYRTIDSTNF